VTSLNVKRNFTDKTQLDLKLEVSTYSKPDAAPRRARARRPTGSAAPAGGVQ